MFETSVYDAVLNKSSIIYCVNFPNDFPFNLLFFFSSDRGFGSKSEHRQFICAPKKSTKMNRDKLTFVTTLLRASRSQDEDTLRQVLESILRNGISELELNATDCSGRVSDRHLFVFQWNSHI